jgi:CheY-like chemotaxis protein
MSAAYEAGGQMSTAPAHILVVDDNDALRENLAESLEIEGYRVAIAADGPAALAELERELPRAILLDLSMPGMDGRELLARIRANPVFAGVRVVVTTGLSGPRARADGLADAFLMKPFGIREVLAALRQVGVEQPGKPDLE